MFNGNFCNCCRKEALLIYFQILLNKSYKSERKVIKVQKQIVDPFVTAGMFNAIINLNY